MSERKLFRREVMHMYRFAKFVALFFLTAAFPMPAMADGGGNDSYLQMNDPDGKVISVKKRKDGKIVKTIRDGNKVRVIVVEPTENPFLKLFKKKAEPESIVAYPFEAFLRAGGRPGAAAAQPAQPTTQPVSCRGAHGTSLPARR